MDEVSVADRPRPSRSERENMLLYKDAIHITAHVSRSSMANSDGLSAILPA